jgi:uncharacterized membrane protein YcaP (DUF421 family)
VLLLLSNSVQNAMTGPDTSLLGGVIAAAVLLALNYFVAKRAGKDRRFRRAVEGSPTLLVHNGTEIPEHMSKEHISADELNRALREHGCNSVQDAALVVLEVDGAISVLKYDDVQEHLKPQRRLRFLHRH